ncbi:MAG: phospho-N-acetylmuramoyl-pentapeptide-transferase [Candidatus Veblenbacteria bacterium]|nr:phospho-N-acetylmuramoyl-pentapeptide-transferase [Candidatus Veblenbacteria bacterium]MDZ4229998.1 phospho-N-acetylmuramoyl-pentapeptide-transferase [Candidatus Veblenbacteria bacterium]
MFQPVLQVLFLTTVSFFVALVFTPVLTHFLYKYRLGKQIRDAESAPIMSKLHAGKSGTPTMGGILVWFTALVVALVFFYLDRFGLAHFNFLTRSETILPLGALVASAIVGLVDDWFNVRGLGPKGGGLTMAHRLLIYAAIALVGAWWFYYKLEWTTLQVPFLGVFDIGWWYVPVFIFIIVATAFSVNEIDGLDGLAGGTLLSAFAAFGAIAFLQGKYDLASFCGVIAGGLLAFLWFNINPARFFMGDTGAMSLGVTLGIVAMLTNSVFLLPIIGFLFVLESLSVIIQVLSKKLRGKKVFLSAPLHHHLEAIGWPEPKIVMRFWVISAVTAVAGLIVALVDKG